MKASSGIRGRRLLSHPTCGHRCLLAAASEGPDGPAMELPGVPLLLPIRETETEEPSAGQRASLRRALIDDNPVMNVIACKAD